MALKFTDNTLRENLERSVYHPDRIHGTTNPSVGDYLERSLYLSTLDTDKTNSRKRIKNFKNDNLPTISDSDEIAATDENDNVDINSSVNNKNQHIKILEDIQKKDLQASIEISSDYVRLSTRSAPDSPSTANNNWNARNPPKFLIVIGAGTCGILIAMYIFKKYK